MFRIDSSIFYVKFCYVLNHIFADFCDEMCLVLTDKDCRINMKIIFIVPKQLTVRCFCYSLLSTRWTTCYHQLMLTHGSNCRRLIFNHVSIKAVVIILISVSKHTTSLRWCMSKAHWCMYSLHLEWHPTLWKYLILSLRLLHRQPTPLTLLEKMLVSQWWALW